MWPRDRGSRFYRIAAIAALLVAITGFFLTYLRPLARGQFHGPGWAHIHGVLLASWLLLLVLQAFLAPRRLALHRKLGWIALPLAPAMAASTMAIGLELARRDVPLMGPQGAAGVIGNFTSPIMFAGLIVAAVLLRRKPQWHKRLILLATVVMLWPAWFRWRHFLPFVPFPEVTLALVLADLPIVIAMIRDRIRFGAVHPAYLCLGLPIIAEQTLETFAFGTSRWQSMGMALYRLFA